MRMIYLCYVVSMKNKVACWWPQGREWLNAWLVDGVVRSCFVNDNLCYIKFCFLANCP